MLKGLMDHDISHETVISRLREKVEARDTELRKLTTWKDVQINKLDYIRKLLEESKASVEALKKILKDKEGEITKTKNQLRQAKEVVVQEYRDFDALLKELGGSYADCFDDCLHQVKASFPNLDLSYVNIDTPAQTSVQPVDSEGTDELFANDTNPDTQGDGDVDHFKQEKSVAVATHHHEEDQVMEERHEETLVAQLQFFALNL